MNKVLQCCAGIRPEDIMHESYEIILFFYAPENVSPASNMLPIILISCSNKTEYTEHERQVNVRNKTREMDDRHN